MKPKRDIKPANMWFKIRYISLIRESMLWFEMTPTCKVCLRACRSTQQEVIQVSIYSVGHCYSPLVGLLVHHKVTPLSLPPPHPACTHLHLRVKRGTVGVKVFCSRTQHIDPARAWTQTSWLGVQWTDHQATVSHQLLLNPLAPKSD